VTGARDPKPGWPTDGAPLETTVDRQVLVAGETLSGLALAFLLQRAGYDPILVGPRDPPRSQLTHLSPPAVRLLDAIGVGDAVLDCGRPVTTVSVRRIDGRNHGTSVWQSDPETPAPVAVRTRDLRRVFRDRLSPDVLREGRSVGAISDGEGGLEVAFDDGVREWFDVVVAAGRIDPPTRAEWAETTADPGADPELTQYETAIETARGGSDRIHDVWTADALLQSIPRPDDRSDLLRVTAVGEVDRSRLRVSEKRRRLPFDPAEAMDAVADAPALTVRQAGTRNEGLLSRWGSGRVLRCGPAALPVAPASGLRSVLGLEDARVLAEELVYGPRSTSDVVDNYARRRRTRVLEIRRRATDIVSRSPCFLPETLSPPLPVTSDMRAVALGQLADRSSSLSWTDTLDGL